MLVIYISVSLFALQFNIRVHCVILYNVVYTIAMHIYLLMKPLTMFSIPETGSLPGKPGASVEPSSLCNLNGKCLSTESAHSNSFPRGF